MQIIRSDSALYKRFSKRVLSGLLSIFMLIGMLPLFFMDISIVVRASVYPEGWKNWKQFDSRWSNSYSLGKYGCVLTSYAISYVRAGIITEEDFTPLKLATWAVSAGAMRNDCWINSHEGILNYPTTENGVHLRMLDGIVKRDCSNWSKEKLVEELVKYRKEGYVITLRDRGGEHTVAVGDPFINTQGKQDIEINDPGWTNGAKAILDSTMNAKLGKPVYFTVMERDDGKKVYPGEQLTEEVTTEVAKSELSVSAVENSETKTKLYRLSRYNEKQKESMAILQNKYMDVYDVAAMKWNMIVTQFAVPYMNNIYDVLKDENWKKLISGVSSVSWEDNPYLTIYSNLQNSDFTSGAKSYLEYLKANSTKLNEVLKLLNDPDKNIYTQLYADDCVSTATLNDLLNGNVLYVHDSQTLIGSAITTRDSGTEKTTEIEIVNEAETQETADLQVPTKESELTIITEQSIEENTNNVNNPEPLQGLGDTTISSNVAMWDGMQKMYEISIKDAKTVYATILERSTVKETNVPVFIATDATELYNNIFINNAIEIMTTDGYYTELDTSRFLSAFASAQLVIDRWGNICAKINDNYVIVYPSYANPLFVSTQLNDTDYAGVYYEALNKQLSKYNLSFTDRDNADYLFFNDTGVQITVADAIKHINNYKTEDNDSYIGYINSFRITTGLDDNAEIVSDIKYDRLSANISNYNPPMFRYDTTTIPIASKAILSMASQSVGVAINNWWSDLRKPYYEEFTKFTDWQEYIDKGNTTDGKISIERFTTYVGLRAINGNAGYNYVTAPQAETTESETENPGLYSIMNGNNILVLSDWKVPETADQKQAKPVFNYPITTEKTSGATTTYMNLDSNIDLTNAKYPFMLYYDGLKGNYKTTNNRNTIHNDILMSIRSNVFSALSANYVREMTYDNMLDATEKVTMYENLYALEYLDSERFNIYITFNSNSPSDTTFSYRRSIDGGYTDSLIKGYLNTSVVNSDAGISNQFVTLVSIPLLATAVDDTSTWNLWKGDGTKIDRNRTVDTTVFVNSGFLEPVFKETNTTLNGANYHTSGLKYMLNTYPVSNSIMQYPLEDIISIAFIWDTYYIANAPIVSKVDVSGLGSESTIYPDNTVITPYNGIDEKNNNTLFYTRETNGSTSMSISTTVNGSSLSESKYTVYRDIYVTGINYPIFLLAVNKNADSTNLQRWVDNLKDADPDGFYVMDLITDFYKHPITGMRNFINGSLQYLHGTISKSTLGSIFNIQCIFDYLWYNNGAFWFIIIYGVLIVIGMFIVGIRYMVAHLEHQLLVKEGRVIILGLLPILMVAFTGPLFTEITGRTMQDITNKVILTELEGHKRSNSKLIYGEDGEVLLDDLIYLQEEFSELNIKMVAGLDGFDNAKIVDVSLLDLYKSISYDSWVNNNITYTGLEEDFGGLSSDSCKLWYNTQEFVPVHYDKYDDSVFYYFYDWIKSNYIQYYSLNNTVSGYEKPNNTITNSAYSTTIKDAETKYLEYSGGIFSMYTDNNYVKFNNGLTDLFGLSYLFKMTDDSGLPVRTYNNGIELEAWAAQEFLDNTNKLSDYESLVKEDADMTVTPIAAIINSPYWNYYKNNRYLLGTDKDRDNLMLYYAFTPDYIQEYRQNNNKFSFDYGWENNNYVIEEEEGTRIPWRLYASNELLARDTSNITGKYKTSMPLENKLFTLNRNIYRQVLTLCDLYETNHISDDTMIFVSALIATFEFNKTFGGKTTSVNLNSLSTDKVFRSTYATKIEDVIDKPNLVYMIYSIGGFFTPGVFVLSELLFVLCMYVRCAVFLLLVIACIFVGFSECAMKDEILLNKLKGIGIQLSVLFAGQFVLISLLKIIEYFIHGTESKGIIFIVTFIFGIICFALTMWHIKMLKALIKDFGSFGFVAFNDELKGLSNLYNKAVNSINRVRVNTVSGRGIKTQSIIGIDDAVSEELNSLRRKNNSDKLSRGLEDEDSDE